ncbi:putative carbonic anhydrase-like [Penaeus vannamei]|uniref:Putative carbonic anhydrase-like n=1 Tax=Penaeus vannamei TaxID=6689 RepID=A0A3R7PY93_PENVA|nr:putative carbonic anhydrase-like [Penaeus vannamei]
MPNISSLDQPQHTANNSRKVPTEDDHSAAARKWFRALTPPSELLDDQLITVDLRQLIPFNDRDFYRYNGSLTTPPCTANVEWTIFENPVAVPLRFLKGLRALANGEGEHISNNFRPPQKLGRRKVLYSGTQPKPNPSCKRQPTKSLSPSCTGIPSLGSFGTVAPGECAEGQATSPADLHLGSATPSYSKRLSWKRRGGCANAVVTLNDRLLKVSFPGEEPQWELSGGDLASPYHLNHLLFRWGSDHHLGGLSFPLEVQLVHYSSKSDDVVIVSKFFQEPIDLPDVLDSFQHTEPSRNKLLEVVFEAAQELSENPNLEKDTGTIFPCLLYPLLAPITHTRPRTHSPSPLTPSRTTSKPQRRLQQGTEETIPSPDISDLVGDASSFYEYGGSFPDAPCLGEVTWMVLRTAGVIARTQLEDLRKLKDENGDEITTNNRPLQPLGNRTLFLRVNQHELVHEYKTMLLRFKRKLENGTLQVSENSGSLQYAAVSLQRMCLLVLAVSFVARLGV